MTTWCLIIINIIIFIFLSPHIIVAPFTVEQCACSSWNPWLAVCAQTHSCVMSAFVHRIDIDMTTVFCSHYHYLRYYRKLFRFKRKETIEKETLISIWKADWRWNWAVNFHRSASIIKGIVSKNVFYWDVHCSMFITQVLTALMTVYCMHCVHTFKQHHNQLVIGCSKFTKIYSIGNSISTSDSPFRKCFCL